MYGRKDDNKPEYLKGFELLAETAVSTLQAALSVTESVLVQSIEKKSFESLQKITKANSDFVVEYTLALK
jgi:hypothetical protein